MNILKIRFTTLINILLKISLSIIIIASAIMCFATFQGFHILSIIVFSLVMFISFWGGYKIINSGFSNKKKIVMILLISAIIRLLWILNTNNVPISDFDTMYQLGGELAEGNKDVLKGLSYAARFPHMIVTILYMGMMRYIFPYSSIIAIKTVNLILGLIVLFILYLIAKEIFKNEKYQLYTLLMGSLFPPFITYTSVFCSENLAMPFYLLSVLLFLKSMKKENHMSIILILSSVALGIGNLFRMIASVILIAYVIYILIYSEENVLNRLRNILCIILPYVIVLTMTSSCLQRMNITEDPLWKGKEPKITSVLRGTNMDTFGMWNEKDASVAQENLGDYDAIEKKCREIIYERFTTTSPVKIAIFAIGKLSTQWCNGDFAGSFWTQKDMGNERIVFEVGSMGSMPFQIIYVIMLILGFLRLINKRGKIKSPALDLFHLILLGYIGAYMITENQCRYGYIVSWIFIILAVDGLKLLLEKSVYKMQSSDAAQFRI